MLTREQAETLTTIVNAGVEKAGSVLSELVGRQVRMQVPLLGVTDFAALHDRIGIDNNVQLVSVCQQFHGSMDGYALLLMSRENADALTQNLIGESVDPSNIELEREEALIEVGNILTNGVLGTISNTIGHRFEYQVPVYRQGSLPEIIGFSSCEASCSVGDSHTLYAKAQFDFDDERVVGSILILLTSGAFNRLIERVDSLRGRARKSVR